MQRQLQEAEAKYKAAHAEGRRLLRDEVTADDVAGVVAVWTGIPVTRLKQSEKEKLLNLQDRLHERVVAQDKAVRQREADYAINGTRPALYFCVCIETPAATIRFTACVVALRNMDRLLSTWVYWG